MNTIPVLAAPALDPGSDRRELTLPAGLTIADIVAAAMPEATEADRARMRVALVNDKGLSVIAPQCWHVVRPKPGVLVVIRLVPGKSALRAVLSIVVSIAAVALGQYWALSIPGLTATGVTIATAAIATGVSLLGQMLINALIPPVKPDTERKPTYSITGWQNRLEPDGAVPVLLGQTRYAPPFAARSYTEIVGDLQYIRALFTFGEGPISLTDFRIGETSLADFDEVEIEVRDGLADDAPVTLYSQQVVEEQIGVDLVKPLQRDDEGNTIRGKVGTKKVKKRINKDTWEEVTVDVYGDLPGEEEPVIRTSGADAASVNVILGWPAGLVRFDSDGKKQSQSVKVRIEQRLAGADEWQLVQELNIKAKKAEAFYRQHGWTFPTRGRWQIRCTMLTDESDDNKIQARTVWAALQTFRPEYPLNYRCPLALVAIRVKATHQLSGALDNFSAVGSRICLDWDIDNQAWIMRATSNPASLYRYVLQCSANPKPAADSEIDLDQLRDWHEFCTAKRLHYNRVLEEVGTTMRDILVEVAAAGRASPRHDGQKWGVVIDRPAELIVDHINPRNSWNFSSRRTYAQKPHAWIVNFQDEGNDYREAQRVIRRPGYTGDITLTETLELPGLTDPEIVYREGVRRFYEAEYRPDVFETTQDGSVRVATRGDAVALSHYVLSRTQWAGRVKAVIGSLVQLDELVGVVEGKDYALRFRVFAGEEDTIGVSVVRAVAPVAAVGGQAGLLNLLGTGDAPEVGDIVHFGEMGTDSFQLFVTALEVTEDQCSIIRAVEASPIIDELTDAAEIPIWSSRVGAEIGENTAQPAAPRFVGITSAAAGAEDAGLITYLLSAGSGSVGAATYEVDHRPGTSGAWTTVTIPAANGGGEIEGYVPGDTAQLRACALSIAGVAGPYSAIVTIVVGGSADLPAALDDGAISITPVLGGALIELSTGEDEVTARVQVYRALWDTLYRETDAVGSPYEVSPLQAYSFPLGDTTRSNLILGGTMIDASAWTADSGWVVDAGLATHTPGTADAIGQAFATTSGKWYRLAFTVSGRTAGTVTPRLVGGSTRPGATVAEDGEHIDRIQAVSGNDHIEFLASADFDGSITGVIAYLETAACLAQGDHYIWLEPQDASGVPGPVAGPFAVSII